MLSVGMPYRRDGTREEETLELPIWGWATTSLQNSSFRIFATWGTHAVLTLAVFTRMTSERLCLGCGLLADEAFCPIPPRDRSGFFKAPIRLRQLVLSDTVPQGLTAEQEALKALMPLAHNRTGSRWFRFFRDLAGDVVVKSMSPVFVVTFT